MLMITGYLYITGRLKSVIVTKNGKNIYPEELEYHLNEEPLISEAIVFGTHNDNDSDTDITSKIFPNVDAIKEYLKKEFINPDDIYQAIRKVVAKLNRKLPNYKHIKKFKVVSEELEKTTTRKIKRFGQNVQI